MINLEIQALSFLDYGPFEFRIEAGNVLGITGPSGSGKTLLLKAIADLIESRGTVTLGGVSRESFQAPIWRKKVMLVPSESHWWHETVGAHFQVDFHTIDWASYGLAEDVGGWPVSQLSSGEKQRLGLARALSRNPQVLLLDEPSANLDWDNTEIIERRIGDYLKDTEASAIWVSHNFEQLERVTTRRAIMENKCLSREGSE